MTGWKSPAEETKTRTNPSSFPHHSKPNQNPMKRNCAGGHIIKLRALPWAQTRTPPSPCWQAVSRWWRCQGSLHLLASHTWSDVCCSSGAGLDTWQRLGELLKLLRVSGANSQICQSSQWGADHELHRGRKQRCLRGG